MGRCFRCIRCSCFSSFSKYFSPKWTVGSAKDCYLKGREFLQLRKENCLFYQKDCLKTVYRILSNKNVRMIFLVQIYFQFLVQFLKGIYLFNFFPAGTATLWQCCHNVFVDVVTTLWHGRKWELCRCRFLTLWQRRSPTLWRRCHNVAATSPQHLAFYYRLFWFLSLHRNVRELPKC